MEADGLLSQANEEAAIQIYLDKVVNQSDWEPTWDEGDIEELANACM